MEVRLRKSLGLINRWTTCRVRDRVSDSKKKMEGEIGNQFVDMIWSSEEGGGASRDIENGDKGQNGDQNS